MVGPKFGGGLVWGLYPQDDFDGSALGEVVRVAIKDLVPDPALLDELRALPAELTALKRDIQELKASPPTRGKSGKMPVPVQVAVRIASSTRVGNVAHGVLDAKSGGNPLLERNNTMPPGMLSLQQLRR